MKARVSRLGSTLLGAVVVAGVGCSTLRMQAPADVVEGSSVLETRGRPRATGLFVREDFELGAYSVVGVHRDWNTQGGSTLGPWSKEERTTGFSYALEAGGAKRAGRCDSVEREQRLWLFGWVEGDVTCSCGDGADRVEARLNPEDQSVWVDGTGYRLRPVYDFQGGGQTATPTGFRVDGDRPLGAVEVVYPGQVWLNRELEESTKEALTCVFAGLMLYQPPSR